MVCKRETSIIIIVVVTDRTATTSLLAAAQQLPYSPVNLRFELKLIATKGILSVT